MGQAKRRGTFEERKEAAIERKKLEADQRNKEKIEKLKAMTPEDRKRKKEAEQSFNELAILAASFEVYHKL